MLYGSPPFDDENTAKLYRQIQQDEIRFPVKGACPVANQFIEAICNKNPEKRLGFNGVEEIKAHPWFQEIDWEAVNELTVETPWKPPIRGALDVTQFDRKFTQEPNALTIEDGEAVGTEVNESLLGFSAENLSEMPDYF
jgi:serine/threonine protein kinase